MNKKINQAIDYQNIPSLRKYVNTKENKNIKELKETATKWAKVSAESRLTYEIDWLGVPIIQTLENSRLSMCPANRAQVRSKRSRRRFFKREW